MLNRAFSLLLLMLIIAGCRVQAEPLLPTLAVLPTIAPTLPADEGPEALDFWQITSGTLTSAAQIDRWQFAALAGDPIRLTSLGAVNLILQSSDGSTLGTGASIEVDLPADGDYTVLVQLLEGQSGRYQMELAYTDRPNPAQFTVTPPPVTVAVPTPTPPYSDLGLFVAQLGNDEAFTKSFLNGPVQPHVYTFEGQAGDYVTAQMLRLSGTVDPALTLYGPGGDALALDHNSGGNRTALLRNIPLSQAGLYSLQAEGGDAPGDYQIQLTLGAQPVPVTPTIVAPPTATPFAILDTQMMTAVPDEPLVPNQPVIGSLLRAGDVNRHPLVAEAGDVVTVGVRKFLPEATLFPVVEVYSPVGELVGAASGRSSNTGGNALLSLLTLPETGTYSVFVTAEGNSSGDYVISYGEGVNYEDTPRGPAEADTPYDGQIARRGMRDSWTLMLSAGDVITVAASPTNNALDPVLELYAPDGSLVASDDNSGGFPNALIGEAQAPVSGAYTLLVSGSSGSSMGPYRLIWRYINVAPTPTYDPPRILLFTVEDAVAEGQYGFYPFQGVAGQQVRIHVIGQVASGFDPVAALIGPDGSVIAEGDDSDGTLNPRFTTTLPSDGTYQVRVNGYLSGGPFELIVERLF